MTVSDGVKKLTELLYEQTHRLSAALRQNRRFAIVMAVILFLSVDAMGAYALTRPAGVVVQGTKQPTDPKPTEKLSYIEGKLSYHGSLYFGNVMSMEVGPTDRKLGTIETSAGSQVKVYTLQNYRPEFCLLGVSHDATGKELRWLYKGTDDLTVKTGADYLENFHLKNNTRRVTLQYDSSAQADPNEFAASHRRAVSPVLWNRFVNALYCAEPASAMERTAPYIPSSAQMKTLRIELLSGVTQLMDLGNDGYITFGLVTFKMNSLAFEEFWNALK